MEFFNGVITKFVVQQAIDEFSSQCAALVDDFCQAFGDVEDKEVRVTDITKLLKFTINHDRVKCTFYDHDIQSGYDTVNCEIEIRRDSIGKAMWDGHTIRIEDLNPIILAMQAEESNIKRLRNFFHSYTERVRSFFSVNHFDSDQK